MKCPGCGYNSFEFFDQCKKCGQDLVPLKSAWHIVPFLQHTEKRVEKPLPPAEIAPPLPPPPVAAPDAEAVTRPEVGPAHDLFDFGSLVPLPPAGASALALQGWAGAAEGETVAPVTRVVPAGDVRQEDATFALGDKAHFEELAVPEKEQKGFGMGRDDLEEFLAEVKYVNDKAPTQRPGKKPR